MPTGFIMLHRIEDWRQKGYWGHQKGIINFLRAYKLPPYNPTQESQISNCLPCPIRKYFVMKMYVKVGEGRIGNLGLADISCYIQDRSTMRFYRIAENDDKP